MRYYIGIRLNTIIENEYKMDALGMLSDEKALKIKKNYIILIPYDLEYDYLKAYDLFRTKDRRVK